MAPGARAPSRGRGAGRPLTIAARSRTHDPGVEDHAGVTRTAAQPAPPPADDHRRGLLLIGVAIVLTGLNLRTAVTSIGPVLQEIEDGLGISSGLAGLVTTMPVLCFAAIGFAGPGLSARFRDSHVLSGALVTMAAGLVVRAVAPAFWLFLLGTVLAMVGGALGNVLLPSLVKRYFPAPHRPDGRRVQHRDVGRRDRRRGVDRADRRGRGRRRLAVGARHLGGLRPARGGPLAVRPGDARGLPRHARRRPAARPPAQPHGRWP